MKEHKYFEAFTDAPRPAREEITECHCEECDAIRDDFCQYDRASVPNDVLERWYDSLPLFSSKAWRYFLPTYLSFAHRKPDTELANMLIINLDLVDGQIRRQLSSKECMAIARFLGEYRSIWDADPEEIKTRKTIEEKYAHRGKRA